MGDAEPLQRLLDLEELKTLKARYFRYLDTKQWERWRQLFTDDVELAGLSAPFADADAFVAAMRVNLQDAWTVHHGHTPELKVSGPSTASGIWPMTDYVEFPQDGERRGLAGWGYYEERYRKVDGGWRIAYMRLTRLRVDPVFGPPLPALQNWVTGDDGRRVPPGRVMWEPLGRLANAVAPSIDEHWRVERAGR
jgi:hypothetical protein